MRYTAEQIKPKRYPQNKPKHNRLVWFEDKVNNQWTRLFGNSGESMFHECESEMDGAWFIDIPGAPEELKPLKYPENLPSEIGKYWVNRRLSDKWEILGWGIWGTEQPDRVDYFIPYRLDREENKMIKRKVERTEKITLHCGEWRIAFDKYKPNDITIWHIKGSVRNDMSITKDSLLDLKNLIEEALKEGE